MKTFLAASLLAAVTASSVAAEPPADIELPAPLRQGGMPLLDALHARRSVRDFDETKEIPLQTLSDLLWATCGVNRPDSGRRTNPTARNFQEIDVYVVLPGGTYRYDAAAHKLVGKVAGDLRAKTGMQPFAATAPLNLVFVSETARMQGDAESKSFYSATDAGFASQNAYLFCASAGLGTVVRGAIDRDAIARAFGLPGTCKVILAQSIGFPKE
ncbi:MAG: nitroreductase family protein [Kiritimatiellia bacterium]|jgi:SagB-type dehydrogenase family enzyme